MAYERSESWLIISELLTTRLEFSYVTMQMIVGGLIPFILLAVVVLMNRYLHERVRNTLSTMAAILCLVQVFSMRWNIVVGGQLMSKSLRGLALALRAGGVRPRRRPDGDRAHDRARSSSCGSSIACSGSRSRRRTRQPMASTRIRPDDPGRRSRRCPASGIHMA